MAIVPVALNFDFYEDTRAYACMPKSRRSFTNESAHLTIPDNVEQGNDVGAAGQILQNLDLSLDLLLLHRLQDLDNAFLVVNNVNALEDLRVLSPACM